MKWIYWAFIDRVQIGEMRWRFDEEASHILSKSQMLCWWASATHKVLRGRPRVKANVKWILCVWLRNNRSACTAHTCSTISWSGPFHSIRRSPPPTMDAECVCENLSSLRWERASVWKRKCNRKHSALRFERRRYVSEWASVPPHSISGN